MTSEIPQLQPCQLNTSWDGFSLQELKHMRSGVMSTLADYVTTFGQSMLRKYGERVHKIAIDADFTCPNRDGSKGHGGCSFCNNASFSPNGIQPAAPLGRRACR